MPVFSSAVPGFSLLAENCGSLKSRWRHVLLAKTAKLRGLLCQQRHLLIKRARKPCMQLSLENAKTSKVISTIYKTLQLVRLAQTFCALLLAMLPKAVLLPFAIYS